MLPRPPLVLARAVLVAVIALLASASAEGASPAMPEGSLQSTSAYFLSLAERGVADANDHWWNPESGWYDERLSNAWDPDKPLARLWDVFPLFEAVDAVAIADPTPANVDAVRAFADKAEQYYDPNLAPVGGYTWYIDTTSPTEHAYFDDDGWWELGFLDAYRATGDTRYLADAEKAFRFIAVSGWSPDGGVWWDTHHLLITAEPLAAEIYVGLALYRITGESSYLQTAQQFLDWADARSWNQHDQLYSRNSTDRTVLDYVEGMMIGAHLELCQITGEQTYCDQAEQLATASVHHSGAEANWTPAGDVIYLRFLLELYQADGNARWYQIVYDNAQRALAHARGLDGLYLRRWNGKSFPAALLQPDAATVSLFAWLATVSTPTPTPVTATAASSTARRLELTPAALQFGPTRLGASAVRPVTVTNTSGSPVTIVDVGFGPLARADSSSTFSIDGTCWNGVALAPSQSCQIDVQFSPTNLQPNSILLTVNSSTGPTTDPQLQIPVQGPGSRASATVAVAPPSSGPRSCPGGAGCDTGPPGQTAPLPA